MKQQIPTLDEVRSLIVNRPRTVTLEDIASRVDVSVSWLKQFVSGEIPNPSYLKVTSIYEFFKGSLH